MPLNLEMLNLNLKMQKLNFPGTDWRVLIALTALIGGQKKP